MHQPRINAVLPPSLLLAAMLALGACGGHDGAGNADAEADVAVDAADATSEADAAPDDGADAVDAPATAEVTHVPNWFPPDVYLPTAYSVVVARDLGAVQQVELRAEGAVAELAAQARDGMQAQGWKQTMQTGETTGYGKDQRVATVTVNARDDGSTRVTYQFTTQ